MWLKNSKKKSKELQNNLKEEIFKRDKLEKKINNYNNQEKELNENISIHEKQQYDNQIKIDKLIKNKNNNNNQEEINKLEKLNQELELKLSEEIEK